MTDNNNQKTALRKTTVPAPRGSMASRITLGLEPVWRLRPSVWLHHVGCMARSNGLRTKQKLRWRSVATELEHRYSKLEKLCALGNRSTAIAMELGEQFRLRIDAFRASGQPEVQVAKVLELEALIPKLAS